MKVIITGGAGFIGSHAVEHFSKAGDDVVIVDKLTYASNPILLKEKNFFKLDICDTDAVESLVKSFSPDLIINFAAETHVDNSIKDCRPFIKSNFEGVFSILEVCRRTETRLVQISTDEVYGPAEGRSFTEEDPVRPMNPYSASKASGDLLIKSFGNTYGTNYLIIRPSNNYGKNQHNEKFIPKLLDSVKNFKEFPLYGAGDQQREWTHVEDTVSNIRKLLISKTEWNQIYNVSSGFMLNNYDVTKLLIDLYNQRFNKKIRHEDIVKLSPDRPGHDKKYWTSSEKLSKIIDAQYTNFSTGLKRLIDEQANS